MIPLRRSIVVALAATAALAASPPAAVAQFPIAPIAGLGEPPVVQGAGPCADTTSLTGQGHTGRPSSQVCMGAGLSFIGPATGQVATVIGPTIISPGFVGNVVVTAGNGTIGP